MAAATDEERDDRIDLASEESVRLWTQSLGISEQELREAVEAVGSSASRVQAWLAPNKPLLGA